MTDTFTLLTKDNPPVSLVVPKAVLVINSTVFRDMLNDSPSLKGGSVEVAETEVELKAFVEVVQGKTEVLETLDEEGWALLAKLADKYQCELVTALVIGKIWELLGQKKEPVLAFVLSTKIRDSQLISRTALSIVDAVVAGNEGEQLEEVWKARLMVWRAQLEAHLFKVYLKRPFQTWQCYPLRCSEQDQLKTWTALGELFARKFSAVCPFRAAVFLELSSPSVCGQHAHAFFEEAEKRDQLYLDSLPPFPMT